MQGQEEEEQERGSATVGSVVFARGSRPLLQWKPVKGGTRKKQGSTEDGFFGSREAAGKNFRKQGEAWRLSSV